MKKILSILNMIAILTFLMLVGLLAYLAGTGRLDKEKAQTVLDLIRHQGTPAGLRDQVYGVLVPTTATAPAPASAPAATPGTDDAPTAASASDRIEYAREAMEQEQLRLEHEAQELQRRQQLLDQKRSEIDAKLAELDSQKKAFQQQAAATQAAGQSEAFAKSLDLYNELKPKQVKDLFIVLPPGDAAEYLKAMDPSSAAKIIAEFKTPEERSYIATVLDKIRTAAPAVGMQSASDPATTAPVDPSQARAP
jgi:flagellar motility protein MotE (MotC chaperone)